jgi:tetratricopeptide (TPR) repeat protein
VVTVLCAEVAVDGKQMDLDDLRELVGVTLAGLVGEVEGLGGTVISISGGVLQALFGAPEAHEDDPERALRVAFRALSWQAAGQTVLGAPLRLGIETGPAVVGPIAAAGKSHYGAVGTVVKVAADLQYMARAGSALIGPATRAAADGLFEWGPSEEVVVGQDAEPLVASHLGQPKVRGVARQPRMGRGPLLGREAELSVLDDALRLAEGGKGSVVILVGEPGLGKTRLVQECRKRFMGWAGASSGRLPLWLEGRCASYTATSPYGLYRQLLSSWVGVGEDQPETVLRPALVKAISAVMGETKLVPWLLRMMGLEGGAGLAGLSPEELRRGIFAALHSLVSRLVRAGPTVLALDDLHWADPTSLLVTQDLAALASKGPLLVLATARPEAEGPSFERLFAAVSTQPVHHVVLRPLAEESEVELARVLIGGAVKMGVLEVARSGVQGNPLFLEERLSSLVETGALVRGEDGWRLVDGARAEVPAVLERLVCSRLDRLSALSRQVARAASVLGGEVGLSLLTAICGGEQSLAPAIAELCTRDLLLEVHRAPEPTYRFRHALIQEATYRGLLRPERQRLHGRAAWALEAMSEGRVGEVAAVIGHHFAVAGKAQLAVKYFDLAGDHAVLAFANDEAISSFRSALDIIDHDRSANKATARLGVDLRAKLAQVLWHIGRSSEAREALDEAVRLADPADSLQRARLQYLLGRLESYYRCYDASLAAFDRALEQLAEPPRGQEDASIALWLQVMVEGMAVVHLQRKEPHLAMAVLTSARPVLDAHEQPALWPAFYQHLAWARTSQNRYCADDEVIDNFRMALATATKIDDKNSSSSAARFLGFFLVLHGELQEAQRHLESSLAVAERSGDIDVRSSDLVGLALAALRRGDVRAVGSLAAQAVAVGEAAGFTDWLGVAKSCLAWVAWREGRTNDVLSLADEAREILRSALGPATFCTWVHAWPLIAVLLGRREVAKAVAAARQLLEPSQQRLPDELESLLILAAAAWDEDQPEVATDQLARALGLAHDLRYF